jgi:RNA polymerase sigma-32 factor
MAKSRKPKVLAKVKRRPAKVAAPTRRVTAKAAPASARAKPSKVAATLPAETTKARPSSVPAEASGATAAPKRPSARRARPGKEERAERPKARLEEPARVDRAEGGESEEVEPEDAEAVPRESSRGLERADPLRAYMADVQRHPLLAREEETSLARQFRSTGDLMAAAKLVSANLRLVVKLAHEYHRNPIALLDLIQEGNIGLMQAVKKFDPERGVKLSTYAAWWIRAYLLRYIMDNWKMVKIGTTEAQRKLFFKLRQEQQRLTSQGIEPSPKLLAERLHVTEKDVEEMDQRLGHDEVSIDAPVGEDGKTTRAERLIPADAVPGADDQLANEEVKRLFRAKLGDFARDLDGKEKYIFEKRLIADEPMTLQDIGSHFGVSRERARQIEAQLIKRIHDYLRQQIPDFDVVAKPDV